MNKKMILYTLGVILCLEGILMIFSGGVGIIYQEDDARFLFIAGLVALLAGGPFVVKKPEKTEMHAKEGYVIVALGWILLSIFGGMPFFFSGSMSSFTDAVFETASGFTTTGATILRDVEALSKCMLFWRSFTHWLGGMGVLVLIIAILPTGANYMHVMRAESPGPSVDKLVPRIRRTALILYGIYFVMTIIEMILLICGGMGIFDAVCLSFGTAGTGGFGTKADSIASYNNYCQIVITIFMVLFGVNFKIYYLILAKHFKDAYENEEMKWYFIIYAVATLLIAFSILKDVGGIGDALRISAFQAASVMTTTGYATVDFNLWATFPKMVMITLMFIGASAGSTGGGVKVSRILIYIKELRREIYKQLHPRGVKVLTEDGRKIDDETIRTANVYLISYVIIFFASALLVSLDGFDFTSTSTAILATLNNIGPGLETVGPMGGFADFGILSKWVMIFDMIAGRLELYPMLVLFAPSTWKKL